MLTLLDSQEGKPSSEATDQEVRHAFSAAAPAAADSDCLAQLIDNFFNTGLEVIKKVVGQEGVGHFSA